jgi:hypothetical protein
MMTSLLIGGLGIAGIIALAVFTSMYQQWRSIQRNKKRLQNYDRLSKVKEQKTVQEKKHEEELEERNLSDNRHEVFMSTTRNPVI